MDGKTAFDQKPIRVGVFSTVEHADKAVRGLLAAGFTDAEISVVCSNEVKERYFHRFEHEQPSGTHTPAAAAGGAAIGGLLGMLSMAAVASTTGGLGLLVFGPLFLSSAGTGAVVGGLVGAMSTRGIEDELADYYDQAVVAGKILVAAESKGADAAALLAKAARVLEEAGAEPVALNPS